MGEHTMKVDRRSFLKGSVILAVGATAGLAGCSANESGGTGQGASTDWDRECDVLVVGSGTAAIAALAAAEYGAESVIILEKGTVFGGTSALSGGGVGIPLSHIAEEAGVEDNIEDVLAYYKAASGGRAEPAVVESYVANGDEFMIWAEEKFGFTWGYTLKMYQDYYEPCEGFLEFGRGNMSVKEIDGVVNEHIAAGVWGKFQEQIDGDDKIELMLETAAIELVLDDAGTVIGVVAEQKDGTSLAIGAGKAVVLGTGGFEYDDEMRRQYLPYPLLSATSVATNTGDGHRMGMRIGADLSCMDRNWGLPGFLTTGEDPAELIANNTIVGNFSGFDAGMYRGLPGSVVVNAKGERIGNESGAYDVFNRAFGRFDTGEASMANIPAFFICDSSYTSAYKLPGQTEVGDPIPEFFVSSESLEGLAETLGIDAANLAAEIAEFNENASQGVDPQFNRGGHAFDINTAGVYAGMRTDIPNPVLSPVETGPFYGAVYVPGTFGTCGGLKTDANAQVLAVDGEPIPHLYAVGNCSSGVSGGAYCHGGMTVGSGTVMSWVAVRHALDVS